MRQQSKGAAADVGWSLIRPGSNKEAKMWINMQWVRLPWQYYLDDSKHPD